MSESELSFTGERFLPSCEREIWYEHYHRYTMALSWVKNLNVLDAACGEGYGSKLLATSAKSVTGVDISEQAIKHAKQNYQQENLNFRQSDVLNLCFEDGTFDVVVSFETLEHLAEHEALIGEFKRVLKPGGVLIISTPDKREYSDKTGFNNEYHVKELYQGEFKALIQSAFNHSEWFGQKLMFGSHIWKLKNTIKTIQYDCMSRDNEVLNEPGFMPVYLLAVASDKPLAEYKSKDFFCFSEQAEQVYGHYNAVIRAHIQAEKDCKALQKQQQRWKQHPVIGRCIKWFGKN